MRYLDISALRPGDIIVTAGDQKSSFWIRAGQCLLHPQLDGIPGYSHAALVIDHGIIFESTGEKGLRFEVLDFFIGEFSGQLGLYVDFSKYKRVKILRHRDIAAHSKTESEDFSQRLIEIACLQHNLKLYPDKQRFLTLIKLPRWLRLTQYFNTSWNRIFAEGDFCSAVVVDILQQAQVYPMEGKVAANTVSPLKLVSSKVLGPVECWRNTVSTRKAESEIVDINWQLKCAIPKHTIRLCQNAMENIGLAESGLERLKTMRDTLEELKAAALSDQPNYKPLEILKQPQQECRPNSADIKFPLMLHKYAVNGLLAELTELNQCFATCTSRCPSSLVCSGHVARILAAREDEVYYWDWVYNLHLEYNSAVMSLLKQK